MKPAGGRLRLYLEAARAEAEALLEIGAPYARLIGRCDVAPSEILTICRHQTETAGMVADQRRHDDGFMANTVSRWVTRAMNDAALAIADGWDWQAVKEAKASVVASINDDKERAVYGAWIVAQARYLDEEGRALAAVSALSKPDAVRVLHRYETIAAARAAADYAMASGGDWPPSPADVGYASVGKMHGLSRRYPSAYGTWGARQEIFQ
jgi:hypothetical protein